jgi:hypothetical protein
MSKTPVARVDFWRQLVAKQQQSGISVRTICQQHGTSEYSFYIGASAYDSSFR